MSNVEPELPPPSGPGKRPIGERSMGAGTVELLSRLRAAGVTLRAEGERLKLSAPDGVLTAEVQAEIVASKPTLLAWLQQADAEAAPPIRRVPRDRPLPLSFAQQRLWFLEQLEPGTPAYNVHHSVRLVGKLDEAALEASLQEIVRRHEVLRTTFATVDGEPVQVIAPEPRLPLARVDLSGLGEAEREREAARLTSEDSLRPFDLERGPLMRATLVRSGPEDHALLFTMHHIVTEGWSGGILVRELGALYEAFRAGRPSPLPELPVQYADFAVWQREWLQGETLERQLSYWRRQLDGVKPLQLPTDRPAPVRPSYRGSTLHRALPPGLGPALESLGRSEGATLYTTLLAAFQVLLSRYTGEEDVVVGSPITTRNRKEIEGLIGFFVNSLAMRGDLSGNPTFRELLRRTREVTLGAYEHQDVPFEKLVEDLQPQREPGRNPFFQVALALQNAPRGDLELEGLRVIRQRMYFTTTRFDLELHLWQGSEGLEAAGCYSEDVFDGATVERLMGHYQSLLEHVVESPDARISELRMTTPAEERAVLALSRGPRPDYPRAATVHERFEAQAALTPDATAVVFGDARLSYAELNRRANRLAHHLRRMGVAPEALVGVCVERSLELVVALLGILKSGAAYLPLDPEHPPERLAFMLDDAGAPVLLARSDVAAGLPPHGAELLPLEELEDRLEAESDANPPASGDAESLAYVIYTSGSTGRPKGVSVDHRAINRLVLQTDYVDLTPDDRVAQASNASFDAATFEIWGALLNGARLVGISRDTALAPEDFAAEIERQGISVLFVTTALFNQVAERAPRAFASLRYLLFGGEAVDPRWVRRVLADAAPEHLLHVYGPTENTTFSTWHGVDAVPETATTVPIGGAIANSDVFVLDPRQRLVPVGLPGELFVGGDGLARGYLSRPGLTAERFVPHPYAEKPGQRLYRTGDRVRWLPEGTIEFLGRTDFQVKIRGFRIELGEIEAALRDHPAVGSAVVVVREGAAEGKRLVAYVAAGSSGATAEGVGPGRSAGELGSELRAHLRERLPDYMVPGSFAVLESLPLTVNGKVDREALPEPDAATGQELQAPRTRTEAVLAGLWGRVLGAPEVGVETSFFDLGGHSLLAAKLVWAIREELEVELPIRCLFETPTVAGLAREIDERRGAGLAWRPALTRRSGGGDAPLSSAQQRVWFVDQLDPGNPAYNMPFAFRLRGPLDTRALRRALAEVVGRHEVLRTTYPAEDGQPVQRVWPASRELPPLVELRVGEEALESRLSELVEEESRHRFDLGSAAPCRMRLVELGPEHRVLQITLHHINFDGWSLGVLLEELSALYGAFASGRPSPLPEPAVQYADYATWQRGWLESPEMEHEVEYWRSRLAGAASELRLPFDRPRSGRSAGRGGYARFALPAETVAGLTALGRRESATTYMTLLTALSVVLSRYTDQTDLLVGTPIANRGSAELESLIGLVLNTIVLRVGLEGNPSGREAVRRVREASVGAFAHQELPFERQVEILHPERSERSAPPVQVMFNLMRFGERRLSLPGVEVEPLVPLTAGPKVDLNVHLGEVPEGLKGAIAYDASLFDASTVERLAESFVTLAGGLARDPEAPISALPLVGTAARDALIGDFNEREDWS